MYSKKSKTLFALQKVVCKFPIRISYVFSRNVLRFIFAKTSHCFAKIQAGYKGNREIYHQQGLIGKRKEKRQIYTTAVGQLGQGGSGAVK
jgi:hypothetical protein